MRSMNSPLVMAFLFLLFGACSEDEVVSTTHDLETSETPVSYTEIITPEMLPFISQRDQEIIGSELSGKILGSLEVPGERTTARQQQVLGPFTGAATLRQTTSNGRFFLSGFPGIAAGIYFCDIFNSEFSVTVQPGDFPILQGASREGYSNAVNRVDGIVTVTSGQTTTYITRSIIIRTNLLGQQINAGPFPRDLRGNVYTYSIFRLH